LTTLAATTGGGDGGDDVVATMLDWLMTVVMVVMMSGFDGDCGMVDFTHFFTDLLLTVVTHAFIPRSSLTHPLILFILHSLSSHFLSHFLLSHLVTHS
jgi:hypothetical protein